MLCPGTLIDTKSLHVVHPQLQGVMRARYRLDGIASLAELTWILPFTDHPRGYTGVGFVISTKPRRESEDTVINYYVLTPDKIGWINNDNMHYVIDTLEISL